MVALRHDEFHALVERMREDFKNADVMTVSEITREIRQSLETGFPSVWIGGEVSEVKRPVSGHVYFSLKDETAKIRSVVFRSALSRIKFVPSDGMEVVAHGRISVYEPRGDYQFICDSIFPGGAGALSAAFEELKAKLEAEGLFLQERKKPLPFFPARIGLVTSITGAAIQDFIRTAVRRFKGVDILVAPVRVQGESAAEEIAAAIEQLNAFSINRGGHGRKPVGVGVDIIALVRGGGSLEDLWSFNEERLVRAIAASKIPIVSGVGHETDFTLADFAADARALTPTDAARLCVPDAGELKLKITGLAGRSAGGLGSTIARKRLEAERIKSRLARFENTADEARQQVEDLSEELERAVFAVIEKLRKNTADLSFRLTGQNPVQKIFLARARTLDMSRRAEMSIQTGLNEKRRLISDRARILGSLSPLNVLDRGYSISFNKDGGIVRDAGDLKPGDQLRTRFSKGEAESEVKKVILPG